MEIVRLWSDPLNEFWILNREALSGPSLGSLREPPGPVVEGSLTSNAAPSSGLFQLFTRVGTKIICTVPIRPAMSGLNLEDEIRWPSNGNLEDEILLLSAAANLGPVPFIAASNTSHWRLFLLLLVLASAAQFPHWFHGLVVPGHGNGALRLMIRSEWSESGGSRATGTVGKCASCFPAGLSLIYWQFNLIIN